MYVGVPLIYRGRNVVYECAHGSILDIAYCMIVSVIIIIHRNRGEEHYRCVIREMRHQL